MHVSSVPLRRRTSRRAAAALALLLWAGGAAAVELRTAAQDATAPKFVARHGPGGPQVVGLCVDILHAIERLDPELRFVGTQHWLPVPRVEAGRHHALQLAAGVGPPQPAQVALVDRLVAAAAAQRPAAGERPMPAGAR